MTILYVYCWAAIFLSFVALISMHTRLSRLDNLIGSLMVAIAFGPFMWPIFIWASIKSTPRALDEERE